MFSKTKNSPEDPPSKEGDGDTPDNVTGKPIDLDSVLINELGQFGRFQFKNILLVSLPIIMSAFMSEYIFSAAAIPHRCQIPECGEDSKNFIFDAEWILNAVPETSSGFSSCERFESTGNGSLDFCPADIFDRNVINTCDSYVYERDDSVVYDFDLGCQEWMRALAGTLSSVGTLLVLPITGYFSDRFGRRLALVVSVFNVGLFGVIRAFSTNYTMYLVLQILQTTFGAGTFSSAYIFAAELVGPKYRVLIGAITPSMFAAGLMVLGGVAYGIHSWRYMILALHVPCFLVISYYWLLGESVRWLLSKQKYTEARAALEEVAKVNRTEISDKSMNALLTPPIQSTTASEGPGLVRYVFRSRVLLRRVCTTPIWWITSTLVYYGLSINSTSLSGSMYLNFVLTCAIEIPGNFVALLILDRIGRKPTLSGGYFLSAACNIVFAFLPSDLDVLRLVIYLLGKFGISVVMTSVYLFTSELYPTEYRHSLLAFSSMIGRIGSISAPLTPALMVYWEGIPSVMFGVMGFIAGILVLTQPETLGTKLPDTLAEAEALGKPESKAFNYNLERSEVPLAGRLAVVNNLTRYRMFNVVRTEVPHKEIDMNIPKDEPISPIDLDSVLISELGQFGRFQWKNILLVSIPIIISGFMSEYIFSAAAIPHRCQIPECGEDKGKFDFEADWIFNAIPETSSGFASCERFGTTGLNGSLEYCPIDIFNRSVITSCDNYVYARDNTAVYDFDLGCREWMRALAGTLSNVGSLVALPITGYFSDRYGRRIVLIISVFNVGLFGVIRAFSTNYTMYLVLQFLQTTFGGGAFSSAYIFGAELVGPKYRVLTGAFTSSMFAVGLMVVGGVSWGIHYWRYMILALHIPCFLIISYYWLLGESVRWLLSKQKYSRARAALEEVAKVNGTKINDKSMEALLTPPEQAVSSSDGVGLIRNIFRSRILLRRVCTTPVWWVTSTLVYYGLSINSTSLSGSMYLNFILTCAIEIPGNFAAVLFLDRVGRKPTLTGGYLLSAVCSITFAFLPDDLNVLRLIIYLLGKFGISVVMTSVYQYTSELYPTEYRHSLLAFSSMVGRIGSISAPLTPALMEYWTGIPTMMFGAMSLLAGLLVLTQPETLGTKLPDTLAEAELLGKPVSKV